MICLWFVIVKCPCMRMQPFGRIQPTQVHHNNSVSLKFSTAKQNRTHRRVRMEQTQRAIRSVSNISHDIKTAWYAYQRAVCVIFGDIFMQIHAV